MQGQESNAECRRIETEAWASAKADSTTKDIRWGRVLGFLEVGTHAGHWSPKRAAEVADSIQQKWGLRRIRRRLQTPPG